METIRDQINILLNGRDLRSIGGSNDVIALIHNQEDFDLLFSYLYNHNRVMVMRAVDAIEKISRQHRSYLDKHKSSLLGLIADAKDKELKWHLAQLVSRLKLNDDEKNKVFEILKQWVLNQKESKIVRVNSIQALYEISDNSELLGESFDEILNVVKEENIPSINARIKQLKAR